MHTAVISVLVVAFDYKPAILKHFETELLGPVVLSHISSGVSKETFFQREKLPCCKHEIERGENSNKDGR